jgi:multidrug transporter EmrE-like cation transporter
MNFAYLIIAFVLNASANILLKLGASRGFSFSSVFQDPWNAANFYVAFAVLAFAGNLVAYLMALKGVPLSVGYPIMIGMTFFLTTGAAIVMGERLTILHIVGLFLILLGVVVVVRATVN